MTAFTEYVLASSYPLNAVFGPDGNMWVADGNGYVWKVTPAGVGTRYTLGFTPTDICTDGVNLYVSGHGSYASVTTAGIVTAYAGYGGPSICFDGTNLWMPGGYLMQVVTTTGSLVRSFSYAGYYGAVIDLVFAAGYIWGADPSYGGFIRQFSTPSSYLGAYSVGSGAAHVPESLCFDGGANLWATNTSNDVFKIPISSPSSYTTYNPVGYANQDIAFDGSLLWLADAGGTPGGVWSFDPSNPTGTQTHYPLAGGVGSDMMGVAPDGGGNIWACDVNNAAVWTNRSVAATMQVVMLPH